MTQLEQFKKTFDDLGIIYHELIEDGYTYIQKITTPESKNKIHIGACKFVELVNTNQLDNYYEFDKNGEITSW